MDAAGMLSIWIQPQDVAVCPHLDAEPLDGRLEYGVSRSRREREGVVDVLFRCDGRRLVRHTGVQNSFEAERGARLVVHRQLAVNIFHGQSCNLLNLSKQIISFLNTYDKRICLQNYKHWPRHGIIGPIKFKIWHCLT